MAKILAVDDDSGMLGLVIYCLEVAGHVVIPARDGTDAQREMGLHPDIELVVTDCDMPEMNGLELAAWIRQNHPDKKIVLMSGRNPDHSGIDAFVPKDGKFSAKLGTVVEKLIRKLA